jgi:hypothetical protein
MSTPCPRCSGNASAILRPLRLPDDPAFRPYACRGGGSIAAASSWRSENETDTANHMSQLPRLNTQNGI